MKKYLFILATAAIVASCSDTDTLKKDIQDGNGEAISFETYASKLTRAENSTALYTWAFVNHHASFQVWGYKSNDADNDIFAGQVVTVGGDQTETTYTYSPYRFWDKTAEKYYFYAAAPQQPTGDNPAWIWDFKDDDIDGAIANMDKGYFETSSTIAGTNLKNLTNAGPSATLTNTFKAANGDVDKMIASPCEFVQSRYAKATPEKVQLNFNHILSKLNIDIAKGTNVADNAYTVTLKEFAVYNVQSTGDFSESTAAVQNGTIDRWDNRSGSVTYYALTNQDPTTFVVTTTPNYIVESLVIPQEIDYKLVALDGEAKEAAAAVERVLYTDYTEYTTAKPNYIITEEQFDALKSSADLAEFKTAVGNNDVTQQQYDALINEITKVFPKDAVLATDAVATNPKPYFKIRYSITYPNNGPEDEFTAYYNLAAAFGAKAEDDNTTTYDDTKIAFNEGWQNTLHIIVNPDKIEFCADVAEWATKVEESIQVIK